jgi:hypothetical protein
MSAAVATAVPGAPALELYRDDGPLAHALGRLAARTRVPAVLAVLAGALPLAVVIAAAGEDAAPGLVAGVLAWVVVLGGLSSGLAHRDRLAWLTPVVLRATEYSGLLWLGALAGGAGVPAVYALLCAVAFRQYDIVYRVRHRGDPPPRWTRVVSGGWEGRLVLGLIAWLAGVLAPVCFAAGAALAVLLVGESALGWARLARTGRRPADEEEDEGDQV